MKELILISLLFYAVTLVYSETPFIQVSMASYYADKFEGRKTASGEIYTHSEFTCAHRTLEFGTIVKITNIDNGKEITCRVNDRAPFFETRIIDVSKS